MLNKITSLLTCKKESAAGGAGGRDRRIAIAACVLLLEMAGADDDFAAPEMDRIRDILNRDLHVAPEDVEAILAVAGEEREGAMDLWTYTSVINEHYSKAEKLKLIEMVWEIAYSDGRLDQYEDHLVHKLANLLHVSHSELIAAKLRVKDLLSRS
ncbi:MAG TPA: TerB family tellurite resistance protein [Spirochaetota bacterium]|nr:TerB family tellurite resistance protein [Spirochaetota bacterium]HPV41831.1 TerB family tellurite resistance protein [Spirochaetota bacterium]